MKHQKKNFDFHRFFVIAAIVIGVGFFLFSLIFSRIILNRASEIVVNQEPGENTQVSSVSRVVSTELEDKNSQIRTSQSEGLSEITDSIHSESEDSVQINDTNEMLAIPLTLPKEEELQSTADHREIARQLEEISTQIQEHSKKLEEVQASQDELMAGQKLLSEDLNAGKISGDEFVSQYEIMDAEFAAKSFEALALIERINALGEQRDSLKAMSND